MSWATEGAWEISRTSALIMESMLTVMQLMVPVQTPPTMVSLKILINTLHVIKVRLMGC